MYRSASCACSSIGRAPVRLVVLPVVSAPMKEESVAAWRVCASTVRASLDRGGRLTWARQRRDDGGEGAREEFWA